MNKSLDKLIVENNGYLITSIASQYGYSRQNVAYYANKNKLEKISRGIYITDNTWPDDLYISLLKNKEIVYSFETSLYLHGLMDREPTFTEVTVKYGYNATRLKEKGYKIHTSIDDIYKMGIVPIKTQFGNIVNTYDMERTICDIIKYKDSMDIQVFNTALKEYVKKKNKRIHVLSEYAERLKVSDQVRTYMEVLL